MVNRFPDYEADNDGSRGVGFGGAPETGNIDTWDTVVLGGLPIRVPMVSFQSLAPFPRKTIFGDATNDSDDYFTTLIYNNLSGGHGVEDMNETTDINRYLVGTLMTRRPNAICKPYLVRRYTSVPLHGTEHYFVGSIFMDATQLYEDVWVYNGNAYYKQNQTLLGATLGVPTDTGVLFAGTSSLTRLVWPTGNGYSRFSSGAGFTNTAAEVDLVPAAISMCNWNGLLIAVDIDGQLWYSSNLDTGWKKYVGAKIPFRQTPYRVLAGFDRGGQKCVYVVTSETVWQFVAEGVALVEIQGFGFPFTNRSGIASCVWNEDLYVASGMNVMRYTGGAKQFMGLDRDDGLPDNYHGYITDLLATDKGMLAFVTWEGIDPETEPKYHSIHEFSGVGWQMIRQMADRITPRSMGISKAGGANRYRLYFGSGTAPVYEIQYLDYPTGPVFPRQVPTYENFQPGIFFLISSWFDAQLSGYVKLANAVEVKLARMKEMSKFRVYAQIDDEDNPWLYLGETSRDGVTAFSFGDADGQEALGETFIKIRFRYELEDHNYRTPYIEYINFSCVKISYPLYTWTFPIDYTRANDGMEPDDIHYVLDELYTAGRMTTFMWKNRLYRGKVTQYYGSGAPGKRNLTSGSVSVLGLPEAISKIWLAKSIR